MWHKKPEKLLLPHTSSCWSSGVWGCAGPCDCGALGRKRRGQCKGIVPGVLRPLRAVGPDKSSPVGWVSSRNQRGTALCSDSFVDGKEKKVFL